MKHSKLRRILLLLACAVLLVGLSVGATLAYLVDKTETVQNTFTVGKVLISLDEKNVDGKDKDGKDNSSEARDIANKYHLLPGGSYTKDPTVHVDPTSENCYVRMIVTVGGYDNLSKAFDASYFDGDMFILHKVVTGWDAGVWQFEAYDSAAHTYEFRYFAVVPKGTSDLPALFQTIKIPEELDNDAISYLANVNIDVEAHAIQAEGFDDVDAAWEAFDKQLK